MKFNLYTVFNRIDGSCDAPVVGRSDDRVATEFANMLYKRNMELTQKKYPPLDASEYELRCVGQFEDSTGEVFSLPPRVVPFTVQPLPNG